MGQNLQLSRHNMNKKHESVSRFEGLEHQGGKTFRLPDSLCTCSNLGYTVRNKSIVLQQDSLFQPAHHCAMCQRIKIFGGASATETRKPKELGSSITRLFFHHLWSLKGEYTWVPLYPNMVNSKLVFFYLKSFQNPMSNLSCINPHA